MALINTILSFEFAALLSLLALLVGGVWGYYRDTVTRHWGILCGVAAFIDLIVLVIMLVHGLGK